MSAAGVAGFIKAALVLDQGRSRRRRRIEAAPGARAGAGAPRGHAAEEPWGRPRTPRRAAVSSFGFGGTNCHLVLEEAPSGARTTSQSRLLRSRCCSSSRPPRPSCWRGHLGGLRRGPRGAPSADIAFTLVRHASARQRRSPSSPAHGSSTTRWRGGCAVAKKTVEGRRKRASGTPRCLARGERRIAFLFPGQGAQAVGLCRALYERFPRFRARLDELAAALDDSLRGRSSPICIRRRRPIPSAPPRAHAHRGLPAGAGRAGLALAEFLGSLGVRPAMTIGHSLGEFVAAGCWTASPRGRAPLRRRARRGHAGAHVEQSTGRLRARRPHAGTGVRGSPPRRLRRRSGRDGRDFHRSCDCGRARRCHQWRRPRQPEPPAAGGGVGHHGRIEALLQRLSAAGIQAQRLPVSHAFHSPLMAGAVHRCLPSWPLASAIPPCRWCRASRPAPTRPATRRARCSSRHATAPVDFVAGIEKCITLGARVFVQVGAGSALATMARQTLQARGHVPAATTTLADAENDGGVRLLETLAQLATLGVPLDLRSLWEGTGARAASLPSPELDTRPFWAVRPPETQEPVAALTFARPPLPLRRPWPRCSNSSTPCAPRSRPSNTRPASSPAPRPLPRPRPSSPLRRGRLRTRLRPLLPVATSPLAPEVESKLLDFVAQASAFPRRPSSPASTGLSAPPASTP